MVWISHIFIHLSYLCSFDLFLTWRCVIIFQCHCGLLISPEQNWIHRVNWRWYENVLMCMHLWIVFTIKTNKFIHKGSPHSIHLLCCIQTNQKKKDFCLKYTVHLETHLSCRQIQKLMNITFCISLQRHLFILVIYLFLSLKSLT